MKIHVKVFPAAGLCNETRELEITLEKDGSMNELLSSLRDMIGINVDKIETLNFVQNGRLLNKHEDIVFRTGDNLWLLPQISGG